MAAKKVRATQTFFVGSQRGNRTVHAGDEFMSDDRIVADYEDFFELVKEDERLRKDDFR